MLDLRRFRAKAFTPAPKSTRALNIQDFREGQPLYSSTGELHWTELETPDTIGG